MHSCAHARPHDESHHQTGTGFFAIWQSEILCAYWDGILLIAQRNIPPCIN